MQRGNAKTDDDAAKHTHLQRLNAAHGRDRSAQHIWRDRPICQDLSIDRQHRVDGYMHDEEGDDGRQRCDFLFLLGHTDGDACRKDQRKVVKDGAAGLGHDREQAVKHCAIAQNALQAIRGDHGFIGK